MKPRPSFVVALVLAVASGASHQLGRIQAERSQPPAPAIQSPPEPALARTLRERYGPTRNSEDLEEWIVRDYFRDERVGMFVDVGANHHRVRSNTYYLDTALGWSGVAIEPQAQFADGYGKFRPRTTFVPMFVSAVSDQDATLWVPGAGGNHRIASYDRAFAEAAGVPASPVHVRTITLDALLDRLRIPAIDFLNMDIELAEPLALAGFSIGRFAPRLVCIEAHDAVQQQILEYFARHHYVLIGKYQLVDHDNYWFVPLEARETGAAVARRR